MTTTHESVKEAEVEVEIAVAACEESTFTTTTIAEGTDHAPHRIMMMHTIVVDATKRIAITEGGIAATVEVPVENMSEEGEDGHPALLTIEMIVTTTAIISIGVEEVAAIETMKKLRECVAGIEKTAEVTLTRRQSIMEPHRMRIKA
jgi:hypothetical protein